MLKVILTFFLLATVLQAIDYSQSQRYAQKVQQMRNRIPSLESQLRLTKRQLQQCLDRCNSISGKASADCTQERTLRQRLGDKVVQLQDKIKDMVRNAGSKFQESSVVQKLKDQFKVLESKLKGQSNKVLDLTSEKSFLQRQVNDFKTKYNEFVTKVQDLEYKASRSVRTHAEEIEKMKNDYEAKLKGSIKQKCDTVSTQFIIKQEQCKKEVRTFGDKIRNLEESAANKAKQFADKISTTKKQVVGRIKNFLTGKGPYSKQDELDFAQFKQKVTELQNKVKDKLTEIQSVQKQKEDIDFQQRYCRAQLTDYDEEIKKLERQAASKGKSYYVQEIKKLQRQRAAAKRPTQTNEQINNHLKDKIASTQQKLKRQLDDNDRLSIQNRGLKQKINQLQLAVEKATSNCGNNINIDHNIVQQNNRLLQENVELRRIIRQVHEIKTK